MTFTLINLSPRAHGTCYAVLEYARELLLALGHEGRIFHMKSAVAPCDSCGYCKEHSECVCDAVNILAEELSGADGFAIATPTHYGAPVSTALSQFTRLLRSKPDSVFGKPYLPIATARRAGAVSAILTLDAVFSFSCCPTVTAPYPTVVLGGDKDAFMKDLEGLQNIREAMLRMVWLAECIKKGKEAGVTLPLPEAKIKTDISKL